MTGRPEATPPKADEALLTDVMLKDHLSRRGDQPEAADLAARIVAAVAEIPHRRIRFLPRLGPPGRLVFPALAAAIVVILAASLAIVQAPAGPLVHTPVPTASATSSPTTVGEWKILAASDTADAYWSPDGNWLMLRYGVTNGEQHLDLFDVRGHLIRRYQGDAVTWIDARTFLLGRGTQQTDPAPSALLGTVDSDTVTPLAMAYPNGPLSNGHGALAFTTGGTYVDGLLHNERELVWTPDGRTTTLPGKAVAWSRDGTKLAVWHFLTPGQGTGGRPSGWLEVLSWPGLKSIASVHDKPTDTLGSAFDPSGRYMAFLSGAIYVLDLQTGQESLVDRVAPSDYYAWDASSHLIVPSDDGSVTVLDVHGTRLSVTPGLGDSVASSADGSTVATFFIGVNDVRPMTVLRNGTQRTVEIPGRIYGGVPVLSADGGGLVVVCQVDGQAQALLLGTRDAGGPSPKATTVGPSPSESTVTVPLDANHSMVLTIDDQSGRLAGARAATAVEQDDPSRPDRDPIAYNPSGTADTRVRLLWIGTICDTMARLLIGPDVQAMTVIEGPRPLCDTAGVGRAVVLTFTQPVNAGSIVVTLIRYPPAASPPPGGLTREGAVALARASITDLASPLVTAVEFGTYGTVGGGFVHQGAPPPDRFVWAITFSGTPLDCHSGPFGIAPGATCPATPYLERVALDFYTGDRLVWAGHWPGSSPNDQPCPNNEPCGP